VKIAEAHRVETQGNPECGQQRSADKGDQRQDGNEEKDGPDSELDG
jgi:hypothetical protein